MNAHELAIRDLKLEIESLKNLALDFAAKADVHQAYADELSHDKEAVQSSIYWRNFYQQKETYCRQRLFALEIKLRQLLA